MSTETKAKHTPGPWELNITAVEHGVFVNAKHAGYTTIIAKVYPAALMADQSANARLIAAAPELLGALKLAMKLGCNCWNWGEYGHQEYCFMPLAEKAISKATGGQL